MTTYRRLKLDALELGKNINFIKLMEIILQQNYMV
jgi:hypothetical protein